MNPNYMVSLSLVCGINECFVQLQDMYHMSEQFAVSVFFCFVLFCFSPDY